MFYPEDIVEEVRTKNDIVDIVSGYVKLQKKGSNYFGLCPFHNEKSPSFSVSPSKQMYYCFGCGAGGNAITFLMEYENYSFPEALQVLADRAYDWLMRNERYGMLLLFALVFFDVGSNALSKTIQWVFDLFCRMVGL